MDLNNISSAANTINSYMAKATRNRIPNFVSESKNTTQLLTLKQNSFNVIADDLRNAEIFLTSAMFFKGRWTTPFNRTSTFRDAFLDEQGNRKGYVNMMYVSAPFPYAVIPNLKCVAIELPYGTVNGQKP